MREETVAAGLTEDDLQHGLILATDVDRELFFAACPSIAVKRPD